MIFKLNADVLQRLFKISTPHGSTQFKDTQSVRLENKDGVAFAIATNSRIIAVENLGETTEPNGAVNLSNDPGIVAWVHSMADAELKFEWYPGMALMFDTHLLPVVPDETRRWVEWSRIFPNELPTKPNGPLYLDGDIIALLASSAPSGQLLFPKFIDRGQTTVVRDLYDPNWLGGFISDTKLAKTEYATLPEWMK